MDPFEEQLKELPWRKPSKELRDRLFSPEEDKVVRGPFHRRLPLAWAALLMLGVGVFAYTHWPMAEMPSIVEQTEHEPMEIASNQSFFDFSASTDDVWSGPLTLTIETN